MDVINPLLALQRRKKVKFTLSLTKMVTDQEIEDCDVVVFCRSTEPAEASVLERVHHRNRPYLFIADDNFFEIPLDSPIGYYHRSPARLFYHARFIREASFVRALSPLMLLRMRGLNPRTELRNCYFEHSAIKGLEKAPKEKTRLVYATSRGSDDQLQKVFLGALKVLLTEESERVEAFFWGPETSDPILKGLPNLHHLPYEPDYHTFIKKFFQMNFDIGLAPLKSDKFHNSKTNNKYREYGACRIAGIYSSGELYDSVVKDGVNGLLVKNDIQSWLTAMRRLVNDHALRLTLIENAHADVQLKFSEEEHSQLLLKDLERTIELNTKFLHKRTITKIVVYSDASFGISNEVFIRNLIDFFEALGVRVYQITQYHKLVYDSSTIVLLLTNCKMFLKDFEQRDESRSIKRVVISQKMVLLKELSGRMPAIFFLGKKARILRSNIWELDKNANRFEHFDHNTLIQFAQLVEQKYRLRFVTYSNKVSSVARAYRRVKLIFAPWLVLAQKLKRSAGFLLLSYIKFVGSLVNPIFWAVKETYQNLKRAVSDFRSERRIRLAIKDINKKEIDNQSRVR